MGSLCVRRQAAAPALLQAASAILGPAGQVFSATRLFFSLETTHLSKLKCFIALYHSDRLLPKAGQTADGSLPDVLTLCLADSFRTQVPRMPAGCQIQDGAWHVQLHASQQAAAAHCTVPQWWGYASSRHLTCNPSCRNPSVSPHLCSVTSLGCWKQLQHPPRAGAVREVSTDSSALFQGKKEKHNPFSSSLVASLNVSGLQFARSWDCKAL